jgi:L-ascorbate metabolism protein UlaG (beta-lactamase superfamily)
MKKILILCFIANLALGCNDAKNKEQSAETVGSEDVQKTDENILNFEINPISHATMVLLWDGKVMYVDPVGGAEAFEDFETPDLILVTDIHGDHMNVETLLAVTADATKIIAPAAVEKNFPEELKAKTMILANGKVANPAGMESFSIEAIPMYNLREEALKFHEKGRGNGYVIEQKRKRVYISGDTEDIPEMRALKNIDVAFVCMNLPYTMTVDSAADAVIAFAPRKVYPYHYRGTEGLSNVAKFNSLVKNSAAAVQVVQLDWYPVE